METVSQGGSEVDFDFSSPILVKMYVVGSTSKIEKTKQNESKH